MPPVSINTGTDISNLSPNTTYTFKVVPLNQNLVSDETTLSRDVIFTTLPKIDSLSLSSVVSSSQINVNIVGGAFNTVQPSYSTDNISYTDYGNILPTTTSIVNYVGLNANTRYYFKMFPYNTNNASGGTVSLTDTNLVTWGNIISFTNTTPTTTDISFSWSGTYKHVVFSYDAYTSGNITENPGFIYINGLTQGTSYTFNLRPYNSIDVAGSNYQLSKSTAFDIPINITTGNINTNYNTTKNITNSYTYNYQYNFISGTTIFVSNRTTNAKILLVAGGGGGGSSYTDTNLADGAGGGGGGGVVYGDISLNTGTTYTIVVGNGGTGVAASNFSTTTNNGSNTKFSYSSSSITVYGGGCGGGTSSSGMTYDFSRNGVPGGSGGGGCGTAGDHQGGAAVSATITNITGLLYSLGNSGGRGDHTSPGGGGGGAVQSGFRYGDGNSKGGNGYKWPYNDSEYGGGGGGGNSRSGTTTYTRGVGGNGGGGNGGTGGNGDNGTDYYGGGGGGAGTSNREANSGGNGGKGIVIILLN